MEILRNIIESSLESALSDIGVQGDFWKKALGPSREKDQGDLSLPCFPFAKQLGKNPADIASELASALSGDFEVAATGGYLNFSAKSDWLVSNVLTSTEMPGSKAVSYTSDAADDLTRVDLGGRRSSKKKKKKQDKNSH